MVISTVELPGHGHLGGPWRGRGDWRALARPARLTGRRRRWQAVGMTTFTDFSATTIDGREQDFSEHAGKPVLVVNTASECGLTPQYEGLEQLHQQYAHQGLVVLGFPCNQFGAQEPGSDAEVADFCQKNYGVSFPMFSKVEVNGEGQHPLFAWLKEASGDTSDIAWNFGKFLVGRDGVSVQRIDPRTEPAELTDDVERALDA